MKTAMEYRKTQSFLWEKGNRDISGKASALVLRCSFKEETSLTGKDSVNMIQEHVPGVLASCGLKGLGVGGRGGERNFWIQHFRV